MTTAKLRIDVSQGLFEAEGSEQFLLTLYNDFKERLATTRAQTPNAHAISEKPAPKTTESTSTAKQSTPQSGKGKKKTRAVPTIVKDLDLSNGKNGRLKDFYGKYDVKSNFDRNLVFVYFMQNELGITGITADHVFSCYRDVGAKLPNALRQSLLDTSNRNGWLDTSSMSDIRVATPGVNHLEHDMARKAPEA